jgi:hypothetical protein
MNKKLPKSVRPTKKVRLALKNARATIDLGGGFERFEFFRIIPPRTNFQFTITSDQRIRTPISGGWSITRNVPVALLNFPQGNNWVFLIGNGLSTDLPTTFFVITKRN